ncbi:MAG: head maturation protease, ClpP-related [Verrucomicrobiota bacterium]
MKPGRITNIAEMKNGMPERLRTLWNDAARLPRPKAAAGELLLYDRIGHDYWDGGGLTHQYVTDWLKALPADSASITVRINSPGGDVFEGVGIYNALITWQTAQAGRKIEVRIDAIAASIASVIAMAGDDIVIAGNAMMMIHPASTVTWGTAENHRQSATLLDQIDGTILATYAARAEQAEADIKGWMDAETFMTAEESVARGFADRAEALKSKPEPAPAPEPDNQSGARLAAARLRSAQMRLSGVAAHLRAKR